MALFIPPPSNGNPIWANDHIWLDIQRPGGAQNTDEAEGTPPATPGGISGTLNNLIGVTVDRHEDGTAPFPVRVQAFVSNPTAGVGAVNGNLLSAGGAAGLQAPLLPAGTSFATPQTVHMDWYPTNTEANINGGHLCIAVNVFDLGGNDGAPLTSGPVNLNDEHMAQRNIHIVVAPAQLREAIFLPFSFYLPEAELLPTFDKEALVRVDRVPPERVLTPVIQEQLLSSNTVTMVGGKPTPEADAPGICLTEPRGRIRLRGGGDLVLARGEFPIHPADPVCELAALGDQEPLEGRRGELQFVPQRGRPQPITAQFEIRPEGRPGGVEEFDFVCELDDGQLAGGLRVVLLAVPQ
jgi:hypothetical protein